MFIWISPFSYGKRRVFIILTSQYFYEKNGFFCNKCMFSFSAAAFRSRCGKVKVRHERGLYSRIAGMEVEAPSWSVGRTQLSPPPKPPTHSFLPQISPWTPERSVCSGIIIVRLCFTPYTNTRLCQSSGKQAKTDVVDSGIWAHTLTLPTTQLLYNM